MTTPASGSGRPAVRRLGRLLLLRPGAWRPPARSPARPPPHPTVPRRRARSRRQRHHLRPEHAGQRDPGDPRRGARRSRSTTRWAPQRYAFLFKPGTYGTAEQPLQIKVGYYTEISGLGASPTDVVINGKVEVYNRCLADGGTGNCLALVNFWRTLSNLSININAAGPGRLPGLGELLGRVPGGVDAPAQHQRRQPVADGLLHRRPAVRQRRLHRRLQAAGRRSTARSSSG